MRGGVPAATVEVRREPPSHGFKVEWVESLETEGGRVRWSDKRSFWKEVLLERIMRGWFGPRKAGGKYLENKICFPFFCASGTRWGLV